MKRILAPAFAVLLALLASAPARSQQTGARILVTGTVVDSVSGNPLYGVAVATTTTPDHTASDSTGAFTLSVPAGAVMLTFTGGGFETVGQVVTATEDVQLGRVALLPRAVRLEPLTASVSLLDQRVRQHNGSRFVYNERALQHTGERDLFEFVMHHAGIHPSPCNAVDTGPMRECFLVRGFPARPRLFVNETEVGSLSTLRAYRPDDVARVEIFSAGAMVRIYTRKYLEMMARTDARPDPLPPF